MVSYTTKTIKIKEIVSYGGHNITANGLVNLTLKAQYSQLVNTIKCTQLLNNDITLIARINNKPENLGTFKIKQIDISGDGESKIKLFGGVDYVETDLINNLPLNIDDVKDFIVLLKADVEVEEQVEDEDED